MTPDVTGPGPVAPGDRWPAPAPLPPEEESRPWWKVAVPAAVVALIVIIGGGIVVLGGGGSGGSDASKPGSSGSVDISDLDDPATTSPKAETTTTTPSSTTVVTASGRYLAISESGIEWSMGAAPEVDELVSAASPDPVGRQWQAEVDDETTEVVEITDLDGAEFDADAVIAAATEPFDADLAEIQDSHIAEANGVTTSFTGTLAGTPVVGYLVAAPVGDQSLVMMTFREGDDLDALYLDFLDLPSTVDLP